MGIYAHHRPVLAVGVIVAGLFLGVNNTLITEAVMAAAPVFGALASGWKPLAHLRTPEAHSEAEATALS